MPRYTLLTFAFLSTAIMASAQIGSAQLGASFSQGWASSQLSTSTSTAFTGGIFANHRFSKSFGAALEFNYLRQYAPSVSGETRGAPSTSFIEVPLLVRIYVVQRADSPWQVNIAGGYAPMFRLSNSEMEFQSEPLKHNLLLGVGVEREISGPFFLGVDLRTRFFDITNSVVPGGHIWSAGLRAGMKLGKL